MLVPHGGSKPGGDTRGGEAYCPKLEVGRIGGSRRRSRHSGRIEKPGACGVKRGSERGRDGANERARSRGIKGIERQHNHFL